MVKEISKQPSIDSTLWFTLMMRVLMKRSKLIKEKHKKNMYFVDQFYGAIFSPVRVSSSQILSGRRKQAPERGMELNPAFREVNRLKISIE